MNKLQFKKPEFLKDVSQHRITIELDQPPYRSILAKRDGCSVYWFRVITYPGGLLYVGDMGTYVFERTHDMFRWWPEKDCHEYIAEKCRSECRISPVWEWDVSLAQDYIRKLKTEYLEVDGFDSKKSAQVLDLERDCSWHWDDLTEDYFIRLCLERGFYDVVECRFTSLSYHFLWCIEAVRWLITHYSSVRVADTLNPDEGVPDPKPVPNILSDSELEQIPPT